MAASKTKAGDYVIYEVNNLVFFYNANSAKILDGITFSVPEGSVLSILGPNGAGKSTLLNCMSGTLTPQSGTVMLSGRNLGSMKPKEIARLMSYVPQEQLPTFGYTVLDFVVMGLAFKIGLFERPSKADYELAEAALEKTGIIHLKNKSIRELSGGERQQAVIARAIVGSPKVILFDEPTAHLDFGNQLRTLRIIKKLAADGFSAVVTTHNPDHAVLLGGQAVLLCKQGRFACGSTEEILTEQRLREMYETDILLRRMEEVGRSVCIYPNL